MRGATIIHLSETALIWYPSRQSGIRCTLRKQQDLELVAVQQNSRSQGKIATNLVQTLHDLQKRPMRAYKRIFGRQWLGFSRFFGARRAALTTGGIRTELLVAAGSINDFSRDPLNASQRLKPCSQPPWSRFSCFAHVAAKLHHTSERAKSASQAPYCFNSISPSLNMISRLCWSDSTILLHGYVSVQPLGFEEKLFGVCTVRQSL
ncbi:Uncharacterized protein Y057_3880 [Fusarium fujikuroi]|nr:Uncharacterized protein Y057_3880 [Fusarium fujikuroi]